MCVVLFDARAASHGNGDNDENADDHDDNDDDDDDDYDCFLFVEPFAPTHLARWVAGLLFLLVMMMMAITCCCRTVYTHSF